MNRFSKLAGALPPGVRLAAGVLTPIATYLATQRATAKASTSRAATHGATHEFAHAVAPVLVRLNTALLRIPLYPFRYPLALSATPTRPTLSGEAPPPPTEQSAQPERTHAVAASPSEIRATREGDTVFQEADPVDEEARARARPVRVLPPVVAARAAAALSPDPSVRPVSPTGSAHSGSPTLSPFPSRPHTPTPARPKSPRRRPTTPVRRSQRIRARAATGTSAPQPPTLPTTLPDVVPRELASTLRDASSYLRHTPLARVDAPPPASAPATPPHQPALLQTVFDQATRATQVDPVPAATPAITATAPSTSSSSDRSQLRPLSAPRLRLAPAYHTRLRNLRAEARRHGLLPVDLTGVHVAETVTDVSLPPSRTAERLREGLEGVQQAAELRAQLGSILEVLGGAAQLAEHLIERTATADERATRAELRQQESEETARINRDHLSAQLHKAQANEAGLKVQLQSTREQVEQLGEQGHHIERKATAAAQTVFNLRQRLAEAETRLNDTRRDADQELGQLRRESQILEARVEHLNNQIGTAHDHIGERDTRIEALTLQSETLQEELDRAVAQRDQIQADAREQEEKLRTNIRTIADNNAKLAAQLHDRQLAQRPIAEVNRQAWAAEQHSRELSREIVRLSRELENATVRPSTVMSSTKTQTEAVAAAGDEELRQTVKYLTEQMAKMKEDYDDAVGRISEQTRTIANLKRQLEVVGKRPVFAREQVDESETESSSQWFGQDEAQDSNDVPETSGKAATDWEGTTRPRAGKPGHSDRAGDGKPAARPTRTKQTRPGDDGGDDSSDDDKGQGDRRDRDRHRRDRDDHHDDQDDDQNDDDSFGPCPRDRPDRCQPCRNRRPGYCRRLSNKKAPLAPFKEEAVKGWVRAVRNLQKQYTEPSVLKSVITSLGAVYNEFLEGPDPVRATVNATIDEVERRFDYGTAELAEAELERIKARPNETMATFTARAVKLARRAMRWPHDEHRLTERIIRLCPADVQYDLRRRPVKITTYARLEREAREIDLAKPIGSRGRPINVGAAAVAADETDETTTSNKNRKKKKKKEKEVTVESAAIPVDAANPAPPTTKKLPSSPCRWCRQMHWSQECPNRQPPATAGVAQQPAAAPSPQLVQQPPMLTAPRFNQGFMPRGPDGFLCYNCGQYGHIRRNCPYCSRCGVAGHSADVCTAPQPRIHQPPQVAASTQRAIAAAPHTLHPTVAAAQPIVTEPNETPNQGFQAAPGEDPSGQQRAPSW